MKRRDSFLFLTPGIKLVGKQRRERCMWMCTTSSERGACLRQQTRNTRNLAALNCLISFRCCYLDSATQKMFPESERARRRRQKIKILLNTANNFNVKTCTMRCLYVFATQRRISQVWFICAALGERRIKITKNLARHFSSLSR
jgi:hypothetical protein